MCHSVHGRPRRNWHDLASTGANCSGVRFFGNLMGVTTRGSNKIPTTKTVSTLRYMVASVEVTAASSNLGERKAGKKCCSSNSSCGGRRRFKTLRTPEHVFNILPI